MRVAGFMSGSGSVLRQIIQNQTNYEVVVIFSNKWNSNACKIGMEFDIPVVVRDLKSYCKSRGVSIYNMKTREDFDKKTVKLINFFEVSVIAYAGYMSIITKPLIYGFVGINVHPADLTILNDNGKRKYVGVHAVKDAILGGETEVRSTTHLLTEKVDGGNILMVSKPVKVNNTENLNIDNFSNVVQNDLKCVGDYDIFPKTLEYLASGRFSKDVEGDIYFDGDIINEGIRL